MANENGITKKIHFSWFVDSSLNEKEFAAINNGLNRMAEKIKSLIGIDYDINRSKADYSKSGTTIGSYSFLNGSVNDTSDNEIRINVVNKRVDSRGNYELFGHQNTMRFPNKNPERAAVILNLDLIRRNSRNENDIEKLVYWTGIHEVGHVFGIGGKHEYRIKNGTAIDNRGEHCVDTTCNMFAGTGVYGTDAASGIKNSNKNIIHCKYCLAEWEAYPYIFDKLGK